MKIHCIALAAILVSGTTSTNNGAVAFAPANKMTKATTTLLATTPTTTESIISGAAKVGAQLGLLYTPIAPFGKAASSASDYDPEFAKIVLGGKGANLKYMSNLGLSVPPGFTISTEVCDRYCNDASWDADLPAVLWGDIVQSIDYIQGEMRSEFGSPDNPLLLSVRSGAAISMPGMMDTVLNLGMNDDVVEGLAKKTENPRFAWDSYRRFLEMFGNVVLEIPRDLFEDELDDLKYEKGVEEDSDLSEEHLRDLVSRFKVVYESKNLSFPQDVYEQLRLSICAVFNGWMGPRAIKYREVENIRDLLGTAVNVQAMVFGNMGETSGTGVCFSRDPNTGTRELFGEFLLNAQGEDVVAGVRTPKPIADMEKIFPEVYKEFLQTTKILEQTFGDMQDIEFTIQEGKLFMLQTRNGKRGGEAAVKIAVDLVDEGLIDHATAVGKVLPEHLDQLLHPRFPDVELPDYKSAILSSGLPASPGAAVGQIALTNDMVVSNKEKGIRSILVRDETSPDDVEGMFASEGILTARGGMTSHAAVVARGWGKPCICGCTSLSVDEANKSITLALEDGTEKTFREGDFLSLNGQTGEILEGSQAVSPPSITGDLKNFMEWVDEIREIDVLTNADTPKDAAEARKNGANGIGLCRSEHMFFKPERISKVRQLILGDEVQEKEALEQLLKFQSDDYFGIFREMNGLPVTIRLLDPPLHEFLPSLKEESVLDECSKQLGITIAELKEKVEGMEEVNPMLGLRGCRLGITRPSIIEMQTRAILEAALDAIKVGIEAKPDIMVPLVGSVSEFLNQKALIQSVASQVFEEREASCDFKIGTMIEIPRAALMAHEIAKEADFFSFGSNDLTQMTFGFSRDDVGSFVPEYLNQGILKDDPFVTLDTEGVGQLIKMTVAKGRKISPDMKIGVCGEHGGDPRSIAFFSNEAGLSYVSCSPFRVPIARLAAAQATVENNKRCTP